MALRLQFVNANRNWESLDLYPQAGARDLSCDICRFPIQGQWYRSVGHHEYKVCNPCVVTYVQPISNNQLELAPEIIRKLVRNNVDMDVYNGMTQYLYSDLSCVDVRCNICTRGWAGWAYLNTCGSSFYACHITCLVQRIGANQRINHLYYDPNPFWPLVAQLSLEALRDVAPAPLNSALTIILKLRAYQLARTRT